MSDSPELVVTDNARASRYELRVDGELAAWCEYSLTGDLIIFMHTESAPEFAGRGLAAELVKAALEDVKGRALSIVPLCPYVAKWIARNPELAQSLPIHHKE